MIMTPFTPEDPFNIISAAGGIPDSPVYIEVPEAPPPYNDPVEELAIEPATAPAIGVTTEREDPLMAWPETAPLRLAS